MGLLQRLGNLLTANLSREIEKAEDPIKKAQELVSALDWEINSLRTRLRSCAAREERAKRDLARKQQQVNLWQERARKAVEKNEEKNATRALERKRRIQAETTNLEVAWWEAVQKKQSLQKELQACEDKAQAVRRLKESLVARARKDRSSSDFIVVSCADTTSAINTGAVHDTTITEELQRLKRKQGKRFSPG